MKLRKILATVAASALAISAMAVSASAAITNENGTEIGDPGKYVFYALDDLGVNVLNVYGVEIGCTYAADADASGGGIAFLNDTTWLGWTEWSNSADWGKAITVADGVLKYTSETPLFTEAGLVKTEESLGARVLVESWGLEMTIDSIKYLDKDGKAVEKGEAPAAPAAAPSITSIESMEVTFEIKGLDAPVDMALTVVTAADAASSKGWSVNADVVSPSVNVPADGTYTVKAEGLAGTVIHNAYVKDVLADKATAGVGATMTITNVKINGFDFGAPLAGAATKAEAVTAGKCLDVAIIHQWMGLADGDVVLSADGLNLVFGGTCGSFEAAVAPDVDDAKDDDVAAAEDDDDDAIVEDDDDDDDAAPADDYVAPTVENGTYSFAPEEEYSDWGSQGFVDYRIVEQFEGDVNVKVDFETTVDDAHTYWLLKPANAMGWAAVTLEKFPTYSGDTDNGYVNFYQQPDGFIKLEESTISSVEFTLTEAQVAELATPGEGDDGAPYGGILFQIYGLNIKSVTFTDATAVEEVVDGNDATEEVTTGDVVAPTTDDKANADTGVEGVAVVAGLAVLAAAGIVVAKKRK